MFSRPLGNLTVRVLTAAVAIPLLLYSLLLAPKWSFIALLWSACLVGALELFRLTLPGEPLLQAWGAIATLVELGVTLVFRDPVAIIGANAALVVAGMLAGLFRPDPIANAAARVSWLIAGPLYLGSLFGLIGRLSLREHGGYWVVLAMLITWLGDTAAYFAGRSLGKYKLYPLVSPNKTVEGALAGLFGSMAGALVAHFWFLPQLPLIGGLALAAVAGAAGQLGDLCESLIKRSYGVKDSGWIIPGHGGMLDRVDALLFVGLIVWLYAECSALPSVS